MKLQTHRPPAFIILVFFILSTSPTAGAEEQKPYRDRLGFGVNYLGGQIRYRAFSHWAGEIRFLTGRDNANEGEVSSQVMGLRLYRFFHQETRLRYFVGGEGALVSAHQRSTRYDTTGTAFGAFGGLEYRLGKRISVGMDVGPYILSLDENMAEASDSSFIFVVNSFVNFFVF